MFSYFSSIDDKSSFKMQGSPFTMLSLNAADLNSFKMAYLIIFD